MRIGMVCYPSYGGSGVVATELGAKLAKRGHEVHFISYEQPFKLSYFDENLYFHEVETMDYPLFKHSPYLVALAGKMAQVAREHRLDLFHVHYAIPHTPAALLARQMLKDRYVPIITTLHGTDVTLVGQDCSFLDITRFSLEESDGLTAVSESLAEETRRIFGEELVIEVIPNFIDPKVYRPMACSALRRRFAAEGEAVLMHISNFRPVKNIDKVIRIFAAVNEQRPARLLMVGDGPERGNAAQLATALGVADRVHFLGKQDCVVELLSIADVFLLPSAKESFGLVALEAMACGAPVVGSAAGGLPEVVVHGETGYLFGLEEEQAMVKGVLELLRDPELHRQFAVRGRQRAIERYHWELVVDRYETYYERICAAELDKIGRLG